MVGRPTQLHCGAVCGRGVEEGKVLLAQFSPLECASKVLNQTNGFQELRYDENSLSDLLLKS